MNTPSKNISSKIPVCTIYLFDTDGRLSQERVYFDWGLLHKQLGLL